MSIFSDAILRYFSRAMDKADLKENKRCLVSLYPSFPCHACRDGCPHGAIGEGLKKKHSACQACGLCAANCPMAAIDAPSSIFALFRAMRRHRAKEQQLRLACQVTVAESYPATVAVPCLAALEPPTMLLPALLHFREVWLHHGNCLTCALEKDGRLAERLSYNFAQAVLLAAFAPGTVLTLSATPPETFAAYCGQTSDYSRRDFLALLRQESQHTVQSGAVLAGSLFWEEADNVVPRWRLWEKLLAAFPDMLKAGQVLPFARLEVSPRCDLCRACTVLCPTKALVIVEDGENITLAHKVAGCVSCGVCARFCPHKAISLRPWSGHELRDSALHTIASAKPQQHPEPEPNKQDTESWTSS